MAKKSDIPEFGLLSDLKVVHASTVAAGPIAAELMAEMGADVIWIESTLAVDTNRGKGGMGAEQDRKNMRNISFNIPSPEGRRILEALVKDADILIESSKGGQWAKWGLTDEVLWSWNPRLVIAHLSGYGQTGDPEYVKRGAYDPIMQAFGCMMHLNGFPDRAPVTAREIPTDYYAGLLTLGVALAAVHKAKQTGIGESIDMAQYEAAIRFQNQRPMDWFNRRVPSARVGNHNDVTAGWGAYTCKDGNDVYMMWLGPSVMKNGLPLFGFEFGSELFPNDKNFVALGTPGGDLLEEKIAELCANHTAEEVESILVNAGVTCSRIMDYEMAEKHPHYMARETITEWEGVDGRKLKGINIVPKLKNYPGQIWRGCPTTGMDNEDILEEAGFTAEEIKEFYDKKIIRKL
jgi:L-carnitine CoA-transferase